MNGSNGIFSFVCIGLFVLVFAVLLLITIVQTQKRKKGLLESTRVLGFVSQAKPDPELLAGLNKIYAPAHVEKLLSLSCKDFGSETYYLFDIQTSKLDQNAESSSEGSTEYANIAVLSPHLDLPPFIMMARITAMPGMLAGMVENLIRSAVARAGLEEYQNVTPEFNLKYMLFTKNDARNEIVFSEAMLTWVAQQEQIVARGEGDLFIYNRFDLQHGQKTDASKLNESFKGARAFCDWVVKKQG